MDKVAALRKAILDSLPLETSTSGNPLPAKWLYIPPAHHKALRVETSLVLGSRGVGKSIWTQALGDNNQRASLGIEIPELNRSEVQIGYSEREEIKQFPNPDTFRRLMNDQFSTYDIWRSVIARWASKLLGEEFPDESWEISTSWVRDHTEDLPELMHRASNRIVEENRFGLIVFDALDRTSQDWPTMDRIVRDLLRAALWLKSFPRLSAKIFLREDQADRTIWDFPDASKLLATRAELFWEPHDLHGLLWQHLINGSGQNGDCLYSLYCDIAKCPNSKDDNPRRLSPETRRSTPTQRSLFEQLAGPWMGKDRRRGVPYSWAVGHLADGKGRTSPRSFLAAIRAAAEDSSERYPDHPTPLHYESLKRGISKASENRVLEIKEDAPWVQTVMGPLRGMNVPCDFSEIVNSWEAAWPSGPISIAVDKLRPQHEEEGWKGLQTDLERLGVFLSRKDGRIDMPDLYRVGFGLGRRGGIAPR